jgi:hypothetical protein
MIFINYIKLLFEYLNSFNTYFLTNFYNNVINNLVFYANQQRFLMNKIGTCNYIVYEIIILMNMNLIALQYYLHIDINSFRQNEFIYFNIKNINISILFKYE